MLILSAGSALAAARWDRRYERTLPLCAMGMVLLLFLFGLLDRLEAGMVCLYILAAGCYLLTAAQLLRTRRLRDFLRNMLTPGAVVFLAAVVLLWRWNAGKLAASWDEFSHWVDIVKAMTYVGDFGTDPAAHSAFQSYPPAISLFQFSLQRLHMLLEPETGFSEELVYLAYQLFFLAAALPLFRDISFRQPMRLMACLVTLFLVPLTFYPSLYGTVYIDPVLGILFGAGMAATLLRPKRDGWHSAYICMLCAMLTLSKDVGIVFSLMLALAHGADCLLDRHESLKRQLLPAFAGLGAAWLPRALWSWELRNSGIRDGFIGELDLGVLWDLLTGKEGAYRAQVVENYQEALLTEGITIEWIALDISYGALTLISLSCLLLLWLALWKSRRETRWGAILAMTGASLVTYLIGLCFAYVFHFSEFEALRLASMDRYLNVVFLSVWLVILLVLGFWLDRYCRWRELQAVFLLVLLLISPAGRFYEFARGDYVEHSATVRTPFEPLAEEIRRHCDGDDRIFFISQATTGFDYWVSRFNARPNAFNGSTWSIGQPFFEGDIWTTPMTPEDWQRSLLEEYDYVALYRVNDYFLENFGSLFAQPEEIEINTLYRVNRATGLLEKCR